ncbi:MAG: class I SAM-dependent methyltransferase [Gammaproteobacteria bacterium]|nr:class I SAM-dependent methyltransferase [Gammaproteobacteria bacterium]
MAHSDPTDIKALARQFAKCERISDFLRLWLTHSLLEETHQEILYQYYVNYRRHFSARVRRFYDEQTREVMAFLERIPRANVLEVGCGCGTESLWLALHGASITAIDLKPERMGVARARQQVLADLLERTIPCNFRLASILDLDGSELYDLIWMEQTFHHLEPRAQVVDHLAALLKPGGYLVISEANALNPFLQLHLLFRRGVRTVDTFVAKDGTEHPYGVERVITATGLTRLFDRRGVKRRVLRYFRVLPSHPVFDHIGWLENWLEGSRLAVLNTHYNYVGCRI